MKKSLTITLASLMFLYADFTHSQGANSELGVMAMNVTDFSSEKPQGPLLKSAPDFANWTVIFEYPESATKEPGSEKISAFPRMEARPRKIVVNKTGATMRIETIEVSGRVKEKWYLGDTQYTLLDGQKLWLESKESSESNDPNYEKQPSTGFSDFEWVSENTYFGRMSFDGRSCHIFVLGGASVLDGGGPNVDAKKIQAILAAQPIVALVDAKSRLPYVLRNRGEVHTFDFGSPPTVKLSIPVDLENMIKKGIEVQKRLMAPIPRP